MVYGTYPAVCARPEEAKATELCNTRLYRDLLALSGLRRPQKLGPLLRYLAFNVGRVIRYDAVARATGLNKNTVADYVELLEASLIVRLSPSYAERVPNELRKSKRIYFCDNGIRNAILGDFTPIACRKDAEALWKNFVFTERLKFHALRNDGTRLYFRRTNENRPHELDLIEVTDGRLIAIACKLSPDEVVRPGSAFTQAYPDCPAHTASPKNLQKLWTIGTE